MSSTRAKDPGKIKAAPNPKSTITTFLVLCFLFSLPCWYLTAHEPPYNPKDQTRGFFLTLATMWSPGVAAILTRLWYQRNLREFGFRLGKPRWLLLGMILPVLAGLLMFGSAWISGVAPLDPAKVSEVFSPRYIPLFLSTLTINCFLALGEELGWRGFLVPELARCMKFTPLALLSGAIWAVWHFPLMIFGAYHGTGTLWFSSIAFTSLIMATAFVQAWLRLASGSVWVAMLLHGFWNHFIIRIYPYLTQKTEAGERMLGEFGWMCAVMSVALLLCFGLLRNRRFLKPRMNDPVPAKAVANTGGRAGL